MRKVISEIVIGSRTIACTEWAITHQLERDQRPGQRPTWIVAEYQCNGIPEVAREYRTLREARARFDALCAAVTSAQHASL